VIVSFRVYEEWVSVQTVASNVRVAIHNGWNGVSMHDNVSRNLVRLEKTDRREWNGDWMVLVPRWCLVAYCVPASNTGMCMRIYAGVYDLTIMNIRVGAPTGRFQ